MASSCANCGRSIGALEQQFEYGGHIVCGPCAKVLAASPDLSETQDQSTFDPGPAPITSHPPASGKRRRRTSALAPVVASVVASAACGLIVWFVVSYRADDVARSAAADASVAQYNQLIVSANQFAMTGHNEAAVGALRDALRLHESSAELQKSVDRTPIEIQIKNLLQKTEAVHDPKLPPQAKSPTTQPSNGDPSFMSVGSTVPPPQNVPPEQVPPDRGNETGFASRFPTGGTDVKPPPVPDAKEDPVEPKSVDAAIDNLRNGQLVAAREGFDQILTQTPDDPRARAGRASAMLLLNDRAAGLAELERICASKSASSASVALLAQELLKDNPVRAVLILNGYLADAGADERGINLLGRALWTCREQGRKGAVIDEGEKLYLRLDQALAAGRPGQKRWGKDWLPADQADRKWASFRAARSELASTSNVISDTQKRLERLKEQYAEAKRSIRREDNSSFRRAITEAENDLAMLRTAMDRAERAYQAVDKPDFGSDQSVAELLAE